jgi:hypothetical protein
MSIRGGFDRLTKEIDALTYNSRSVLNALIRSTVASGSSQGYTVTRVGVELTLSRVDIYRLYTFYQAWEANDFATVSGQTTSSGRVLLTFDQLRLQQDDTPVVDDSGTATYGATTDALVTHSQILFLNSTTLGLSSSTVINGQIVDNTNSTNYWLGQLTDFNDPKLLTNSAPIPINLRTPVFDENMATTAYNNHPTYLFPYQYFGMQLLGYLGDDTDHYGGGKSWTWEVEEYVTFKTPSFASGGVNSESVYKTSAQRNFRINPSTGVAFEPTYSTVWGYDTHARSLYSTAGGRSSMVPRGANNSTAIGLRNLASDIQTTSIGGTTNQSVAQNSGVYVGRNNITAGNVSFATGADNITGGVTFNFTLPLSNTSDQCIPDTSECGEGVIETTGSQFGNNQIAVNGNVISSTVNSLDGFAVGDTVVVYAYTTFVAGTNESNNEYFTTNGDTFISVTSRIIGMGYDDSSTSLNSNKTIITLEDDLPNPARIDGGSVTRKTGVFSDNTTLNLGHTSSVFGLGNMASGVTQTVVGQYNRPVVVDTTSNVNDQPDNFRMSRFVVGSGSSDSNRLNTLEVYDGRMVVYANGQSIEDVPVTSTDYSTFRGFSVDNRSIRLMYDTTRIEANSGGFILEKNTGTENSVFIRTANAGSGMLDQLRIENWYKSIRIQTGDNTQKVGDSYVGDLDIALISKVDVEISALDDVWIDAGSYIGIKAVEGLSLGFTDLVLDGNTLGALPTTDKQFSHIDNSDDADYDTITRSGFYFISSESTVNGPAGPNPAGTDGGIGTGISDGVHLLTLGVDESVNNGNSLMQLAYAGADTSGATDIATVGRPAVRTVSSNGNNTPWRNLAYIDDVGTWIRDSSVVEELQVLDNTGTVESTDTDTPDWNPIIVVNYCRSASTVFLKIRMSNLQAGFPDGGGTQKSLRIVFNSGLGIGEFGNAVDNDRTFDTANVLNISAPPVGQGRFFATFDSGQLNIDIGAFQDDGTIADDIDVSHSGSNSVVLPYNLTFNMYCGYRIS